MLARMKPSDGNSADLLRIIVDAAASIGAYTMEKVSKPKGGMQFRLVLGAGPHEKYEKINYSVDGTPRHTGKLCWHAFRDFFYAAYERNPNLYFNTGIGVYSINAPRRNVEYLSLEHFERTYPETNIEIVHGGVTRFLSQCCNCEEANL